MPTWPEALVSITSKMARPSVSEGGGAARREARCASSRRNSARPSLPRDKTHWSWGLGLDLGLELGLGLGLRLRLGLGLGLGSGQGLG